MIPKLPMFYLGVTVNFIGLFAIEIVRFFVGMASFTEDMSTAFELINFISWLWSPIAKLFYSNVDFFFYSVGYTLTSIISMGVAFVFMGQLIIKSKENNESTCDE